MRAIKVNSETQSLTEVQIADDSDKRLSELQEAVGGYITEGYGFENRDMLFVDDEGLLKNPQHFMFIPAHERILAGNGIIIGTTQYGNSCDAKSTIEELKKLMFFGSRKNARFWAEMWGI